VTDDGYRGGGAGSLAGGGVGWWEKVPNEPRYPTFSRGFMAADKKKPVQVADRWLSRGPVRGPRWGHGGVGVPRVMTSRPLPRPVRAAVVIL